MNNKKVSQKSSARLKQRNRRILTFMRMCRYGVNNFSRNAWLTIAATAVMSVTLLIIFITLAARQVLLDTVNSVSSQADISIYLKGDVSPDAVKEIESDISKLDNVAGVRYISADEARDEQAKQFKDDPEALAAIKESSNEMSATIRVSVKDLNNHKSLDDYIATNEVYEKNKSKRQKPSFSGERRQAISTIGEWVKVASIGGSIAVVVFVIISSLVVFNTIRMAIFNRKDEIEMMKLIGAEKSFIRGPFIMEAVMYGFIAAIIATIIGYILIMLSQERLSQYGIPVEGLITTITTYIGFVLLGMIITGAVIGVASSWVATRKYLKL